MFAQLPDFTQTDCNGVSHHLYTDLQAGNVVVLDFSALWCGPCREIAPIMEQFYRDFSSGTCRVKQYLMLFDGAIPDGGSDCNDTNTFVRLFHITTPVLTDIGTRDTGVTGQFLQLYDTGGDDVGAGESESGVPFILVIFPDVANPANSTVKRILGYSPDVEDKLKGLLALGGVNAPPLISITGDLCTDQAFNATLTSGFESGNILWSTNATTPSIVVNQTGTYSVTDNTTGCTISKYVEFNHPPVMGTASISSNNVCEQGAFTINYGVPLNGETNVVWEMAMSPDYEWTNLGFDPISANEGPLTLLAGDPAGTTYKLRVKGVSGSGINNCIGYSNEVEITVNNSTPTSIPGTASVSTNEVCMETQYTLSYSGGIENSLWEYYADFSGQWLPWGPADDQPLPLTALHPATTVNGLPGDRFRVKSPDGDCYALSNEVEIGYLPSPLVDIIGPDSVCAGGTGATLQLNGTYSSVLWSTGQTNPSIVVNPTTATFYTVSVTGDNGCAGAAGHWVNVVAKMIPIINASSTGVVCGGSAVTLSFGGTNSVSPCTTAPFGQFPAQAHTFTNCNGTFELITDEGFAGQYSVVNVTVGKYYYFASHDFFDPLFSTNETDYVNTITSADGAQVYATGLQIAIWKASFTGQVRFYTSKPGCGADDASTLSKGAACFTDPTAMGSFHWSTGQTTPSITVNPNVTTTYSLTFTETFTGCSHTNSQIVVVGISSSNLTTTNITCNSAKLNWTASFDPAQWQVQYKTTATGSKWIDVPVMAGSTHSLAISGLKANQSYNWHIRAKCGKNFTDYSNAADFKTLKTCAGSVTEARVSPENIESDLQVRAMPNPSNTNFTVTVKGNGQSDVIKMIVVDMYGRMIEERILPNEQTITLGDRYRPGVYIVKFIQGGQTKQLKLIKLSE